MEMYYVSSLRGVLRHFLDQLGETDQSHWLYCQRSAVWSVCLQLNTTSDQACYTCGSEENTVHGDFLELVLAAFIGEEQWCSLHDTQVYRVYPLGKLNDFRTHTYKNARITLRNDDCFVRELTLRS